LSLLVCASSLSVAVLWIGRARIFGSSLGMPPHFAVLTSSRYAAFSSAALMVLLFMVMNMKRRGLALSIGGALFTLCAGSAGIAIVCTNRVRPYGIEQMEVAATGLLMGMSPVDNETVVVWPGVHDDSYWPNELRRTAAYIRSAGISYAYRMPLLGQFYSGSMRPI
jgi:hypothetical protein